MFVNADPPFVLNLPLHSRHQISAAYFRECHGVSYANGLTRGIQRHDRVHNRRLESRGSAENVENHFRQRRRRH